MNPLSSTSHESISRRAYHLWEEAGRPDGRHEEHWHQAERDLEALDARASANGNRSGHVPEKARHSTNYVHPGVSTDSLHHHRH